MQYITGIHALNLNCSLKTPGDWHQSALQWDHPTVADSEDSFFGEYGIEDCVHVPEHSGSFKIANHIRAALDLMVNGNFAQIKGLKKNLICNDQYTPEIFEKVGQLRCQKNWPQISNFMGLEYGIEWLRYLGRI